MGAEWRNSGNRVPNTAQGLLFAGIRSYGEMVLYVPFFLNRAPQIGSREAAIVLQDAEKLWPDVWSLRADKEIAA